MDDLRGWPEPVVPVQSIAENNPTTIPERYVQPPTHRHSASDAANHTLSVPVVNLNDDAAASAVSAACCEWGFFQIVNHGVSPHLLRRVREVWREFFSLPTAEKLRYANNPVTYEGYGSRLGVEKDIILDWGDYFFLHLLPVKLKDPSKWPAMPKDCREVVEEYGREVATLCRKITEVLSIGLALEKDRLDEAFGGQGIGMCLRVNFYPKCPQPELTFGVSPHSDPGGITVLLADEAVDGLQVRRGDCWVPVRPLADALIVNVGDQVQVLSNATYRSVEHRAIVNSKVDRLSLAFFYNPKSDIPIEPIPELVAPGRQPLYKPMTFDEYRLYIRTKGPRGKSQMASMEHI